MVRALAALEVMFSHLKPFVFDFYANHSEPHNLGLGLRALNYATGFGHQAVTVFFVLSGYFVGGSVMAAKPEGFWPRYLIQRLSRLWIVLIPALAMTLVWNVLDSNNGGVAYLADGGNPVSRALPAVRLDALTFFGNVFFLQTICVPFYGDNSPLWSLAQEFWFYILFPLLFFGVISRWPAKLRGRSVMVLAAAALMIVLPREFLAGFAIWLLGAAVAALEDRPLGAVFSGWMVGLPSVLVCGLLLHLSRYRPETAGTELGIGFALAAAAPWVMRVVKLRPAAGKVAAFFSDFSYTLYVAHFSFMAFVWCAFFHSERLAPGSRGFARFVFIAVLVVAYSYGLSWLFERNTDKLRRFLTRWLAPRKTGVAAV